MYCTNCGGKVNDDALFCTNCGTKIKRVSVTETMTEKEIKTNIPVKNQIPEAVPVERPVQEVDFIREDVVKEEKEEVIPVSISIQPVPPAPMDIGISENINNNRFQYNNSGNIEAYEPVKERNIIIPLAVFSIIFSILTIGAAVIEMLDGSSGMSDVAYLIEVSIAAVIILVFAVTDIRTVSFLKGIALLIFMVSDIIFVSFSSVKYSIETLNNGTGIIAEYFNVSEGLVMAYMVTVIVWFASMYIFIAADAIRAFIGTKKAKIVTLFFGYIGLLAVIMQIIFKLIIEGKVEMYLGFLPVNFTYIFFLLAVMLGISSKKKTAKK